MCCGMWSKRAALRRFAFPFRRSQNAARETEFESLHNRRRILVLRFTDQKVDVLGHDDVSDHDELVAAAHLLQHGEKELATEGCAQQWLPPIATAGDDKD